MRIVHILLTKNFGGTERHVVELTAAQAEAGHEVTLILRRKAARSAADAIAHRVDPRVRVLRVADWVARWPAIPQARRLVRQLRPDIAHAHLGMACQALRGLEGIAPRLSTLHLDYDPAQHGHLDGLVAIAPWQLPTIPAPLRACSVQIDNWTHARRPADDARERLRAQIGVGPDEFLFGALGRVVPMKGMDLLVEAFRQATLPGARLAIVGHGHGWDDVRRRADPGVAMPGFAERTEDWMAAFDCFVSPARAEPFGLVLLEAMQAGLPILATATDGARHLAASIGTPLVPLEDVPALARALAAVHAQRPGRRRYAMEGFRVEAKAAELETYYRAARQRLGLSDG
jgi:glycosyltransferase involved in cell wall biosynthesis